MNRMGFVNFWLYDEETFPFADGKLFLRGANASGKSITTQSFIPFILDGDRSPERLDPFGSKDRKMEYYFLGNDDKDDVTGYLFLEFKKEDTEQYRTIGIGQKAQKGKSMSFWGFIILDGKRIGHNINLYREIGSKKVPYQKQDLRKVLGEDNILADSQKEYMEYVNKYIFGFPKIEQYDQYIRLMIKVRAPKLSRDFKPTKVYEILNESIQTLSEEDLRAMIDAMEKMDDIQGRLDSLKTAFTDLHSIRNEYDHYNRYLLSKKARAFLDAKKQVDVSTSKLDAYKDELRKAQEDKVTKERENEQLNELITILKKEKEVLDATDIESYVEKLRTQKIEKEGLEKESKDLGKKIEDHRNRIREYDSKQRAYKNAIEGNQYEIDKILQELEETNETLQFNQNGLVKNVIKEDYVRNGLASIKSALKEYLAAIEKGLKVLQEMAKIEDVWNKLEEEISVLKFNKGQCEEQLNIAEGMEIQCRDAIIEDFYILSGKYQELVIAKQELDMIISCIIKYGGAKDLGEIKKIVDGVYKIKSRKLFELLIETQKNKDDLVNQYKNSVESLEMLRNMKQPIPERREKVTKARKTLLEKGINCLPFYEAVEFNELLSTEERSLLEEQLIDAGLLDALVVSNNDYNKAKAELSYLSDILLRADNNIHTGFDKLIPGEIESELRACVAQILDNISEEYLGNARLILSSDGYFKNGIIEGHSMAEGQASFVGTLARRQKMLRLIAEKEAECIFIEGNLHDCDLKVESIKNSIKTLEQEYDGIPQFGDLDQAIGIVQDANYSLTKACEEYEKKGKELVALTNIRKACEQNIILSCKGLPFERKVESYQVASESIEDYRELLIELEGIIGYLRTSESNYRNIQDLIYKEEDAIDDTDLQLKKANQRIKVYKAEIDQIEEFLNSSENKERAEKLEKVKAQIEEKQNKTINNDKDIKVLEYQVDNKKDDIEGLNRIIINESEKENKLRMYYKEELELGLVINQGGKSLIECSSEAIASIRENDKNKSISDIVASLHKIYQQHNSNLTSYGTSLEDRFEDDAENTNILRKRQCIVSTWQGKKLYLEEFYGVLKESIESTELLIQEKDRELFENILADTLIRKLSNRISESKIWIKNMSKLMLDMDTSMGLTFSLDWKPRVADNDKELDTQELEKLLSRDRELLSIEDIEKVSMHFRSKIRLAQQVAEDNGDVINYSDLVREALDYRQWFEFKMYFYRNGDAKKELTNSAFNKFSGGEKAMAMYVPLLAAVNAQYKKSENPDHPRIIALDEAFAGVDDRNISSMFELVQKLDYDYIMNSQALWGCYETVKSLRIAELLRPANSSVVTVIYYYWNGKERVLCEQ